MEKLLLKSKSNFLNKFGFFPLKYDFDSNQFKFSKLEYVKFAILTIICHLQNILFWIIWYLFRSELSLTDIFQQNGKNLILKYTYWYTARF